MSLDEDVLRDVEAARDRLESLEDAAYEARATFHQVIRRLHTTGGSMREIATALGMSHQRVHQIIGTEGIVEVEPSAVTEVSTLISHPGSAVAITGAEDACSFCGAPRRERQKLLAGPGPVFICGACVAQANLAVQHRSAPNFSTLAGDETSTCSFCGNVASVVGGVMAEAADGELRICARCTETCRKLVADEEPKRTMTRRNPRLRCSFCNSTADEAKKIIAGPGVYICGACVAAGSSVVATGVASKGPRQVVLRPAITEPHGCSFCDKPVGALKQVVRGGRGRICNECIDLCEDIIRQEA